MRNQIYFQLQPVYSPFTLHLLYISHKTRLKTLQFNLIGWLYPNFRCKGAAFYFYCIVIDIIIIISLLKKVVFTIYDVQ